VVRGYVVVFGVGSLSLRPPELNIPLEQSEPIFAILGGDGGKLNGNYCARYIKYSVFKVTPP
jgi:hypothetical protein